MDKMLLVQLVKKKELFGAVDLNLLALRRRTQPHTAKQMLDNILI